MGTVANINDPLQPIPFAQVEEDLSSCSLMDKFRMLPADERRKRIKALPAEHVALIPFIWKWWARPSQLPPRGEWLTWIVQAGRGYGKTRVGAEMARQWKDEVSITHIIAPTASDIHKVILEGPAGLMHITAPHERPHLRTKDSTLEWPNGAKTLLFSAEEPERLRGPQCYKLWADEVAAWKYAEKTWDNAAFGLRLGDNPQAVVTTTPRPTKLYKRLVKEAGTIVTRGTTRENRHNLSKRFITEVIKRYEGTRLGRQELDAELLEDNPGALWTLDMIAADRIDAEVFDARIFATLARVVTGVDPAVTSNEDSDETGIITVGRDQQRPPHFYVFDDRSCIERPQGWATRAVNAYKQFNSDRIVGEVNNGGEMVETTIHHVDPNASFKAVHASRGKITRAEPISALYEQHRVHHVGHLPKLEDQMCDYDPATATFSPDRMDALVWGITDLMEGGHGLLELWDRQITARKAEEQNPQRVVVAAGNHAQSAEEKAAMGLYKVQTPKDLAKPTTSSKLGAQTQACPNCGNVALARYIEGAWKCNGCGASGRDPWEGMSVGTVLRK